MFRSLAGGVLYIDVKRTTREYWRIGWLGDCVLLSVSRHGEASVLPLPSIETVGELKSLIELVMGKERE